MSEPGKVTYTTISGSEETHAAFDTAAAVVEGRFGEFCANAIGGGPSTHDPCVERDRLCGVVPSIVTLRSAPHGPGSPSRESRRRRGALVVASS